MSQQTSDQEFLARLDAAIGCQQCGGPLTQSVSDYFCSERCSMIYSESRASDLVYEYWDEDEHGWTAEALADLGPVSWIAPPIWRLPRSTGDLEADGFALAHAIDTSTTDAHMAACELRCQSLAERQRVIWAREWKLPRESGTYFHAQIDLNFAERTATTDAQRAACKLRRESLELRHPRPKPPFPGDSTQWEFDHHASPLVHSRITWNPVVTDEQAQQTANALLARYETQMSRVALTFAPPPVPAGPALREGHHVTVTSHDGTHRYVVEGVGPGSHLTLRRVSGDQAIEGDEQPVIDETTPATPQARALEARRNRNTGPTPRPGRTSGNVPGARR